ncbi:M56 family metallopeptidase [Gorillibacterium timonense]|uniref:M56 family metallopeptidase n=1 Tax=Gorillibacterium timonense TaxID=1689269 RepID=UPI0009E9B04D|nr:M56 family metallopeptidase [Gorillibacterium timonense]
MKHLEAAFTLLFTASLTATIILLLLLLIRKLVQNRLSPRVISILWLLVLVKLLVPIAPQSSVSLFNLVPQGLPIEWNFHQRDALLDGSSTSDSRSEITVTHSEGDKLLPGPASNPTDEPNPAVENSSPPNALAKAMDGANGLTIGSLVWLVGLLGFAGYYLVSAMTFRVRIRESRRLDNPEALTVLEACRKKLNLRKAIPIYETRLLRSPCLYGLRKPRIYLPEDLVAIADSKQLTHILLHELAHYKRKDLWFNSLWALSIGLHWYNPFVWFAAKKRKADVEVSCDASVLEILGEREASEYGGTLLMLSRFVSRGVSSRMSLSHFFEKPNELKRRITMIAKFKKGSYKLSIAAIVLVLSLGAVLLTNASEAAEGADSSIGNPIGARKTGDSSFMLVRLNDFSKWFHDLDRATDYSGFDFKVPDYLPEGYRLQNVDVDEKYVKRIDNLVFITFVSNFGQEDEHIIELVASKGNLLETHDLVWGTGNIAPYSWGAALPLAYRHDPLTLGDIQGILVTQTQAYEHHESETAKSFVWQDEGVWYAINYYSENHTLKEGHPLHRRNITEDELAKIVDSFAFPQQIRHVRYDGEGNSFPLYDETDLRRAKDILGFKVKFPLDLPDTQLTLINSVLLRKDDQNTGYSFRQAADALWNSYRAPYDSTDYELNDELSLYQSRTPLFDTAKLSVIRKLEIDGIEISAYADNDHVYYGPLYLDSNQSKVRSQTYYLWKQNDIYYTAVCLGMDKNQEELLKPLVLAPVQ